MNTYHETDDGDALIVVCETTGGVTIRGMGKAGDIRKGKIREQLGRAFEKVTA